MSSRFALSEIDENERKQYFRSRRGLLSNIIVTDVDKDNMEEIFPHIIESIKRATFISIDLELSGIGALKVHRQNLGLRYDSLLEVVKTRSILGVGLSIFKIAERNKEANRKRVKLDCRIFNILTISAHAFTSDPDSLQFLAENQFDFQRTYSHGVRYDCIGVNAKASSKVFRNIWLEILKSRIPVVLHNGFIDLLFIYEKFYDNLPKTLETFIANTSDWVQLDGSGIYDSKYAAAVTCSSESTNLQYLFRNLQRQNAMEASSSRAYLTINFRNSLLKRDTVKSRTYFYPYNLPACFYNYPIQIDKPSPTALVCKRYAMYGSCTKKNCSQIHSLDLALDQAYQIEIRKRERRRSRFDHYSMCTDNGVEEDADGKFFASKSAQQCVTSDNCSIDTTTDFKDDYRNDGFSFACHSAGVDSFFAGFSIAFITRMNLFQDGTLNPELGNFLFNSSSNIHLKFLKSEYSKPSAGHVCIWSKVKNEMK